MDDTSRRGGFVRWMLHREKHPWTKRTTHPVIPDTHYHGDDLKITFVGHATVLIQTRGLNILTDPVWSYRVSPFSFMGPHRYLGVGVELEHLPPIDIILLSHNHYDHMDLETLQFLEKRDRPTIYTGLGNKAYLADRSITNVVEMDWWDEQIQEKNHQLSTRIIFLPAQHFSARGITDRNTTLWGGFRVEIGEKSFYFAGDTGHGPFIEHIAERFPEGFDLGLIPIGAYKPRWFMAAVHTNPEEGLRLQKELGVKTGIAIHYGTFSLADDNQDEPLEDLAIAQTREEYASLDFRHGPNGTIWNVK